MMGGSVAVLLRRVVVAAFLTGVVVSAVCLVVAGWLVAAPLGWLAAAVAAGVLAWLLSRVDLPGDRPR